MSAVVESPQGAQTTMTALKPVEDKIDIPVGTVAGFETLQSFVLMQRIAKLLAASSLIPEQYRGNLPNCVIAMNMAQRIGADPLMVMQNLYVVHGRPGWSAQFLIASFNQCGRFSAIRYKWGGTEGKDDWSCQAYATELSSKEIITGPTITIALAKKEQWYQKNGSKWQSIPQLMLMYRAAAWLVRTHAPEIAMGLQTAEELHDTFDAKSQGNGRFAVDLESLRTPEGTTLSAAGDDVIPQYAAASAVQALKEAGDLKTLNEAWDDIIKDYDATKRPFPPEVEPLYKDRKAHFEQL